MANDLNWNLPKTTAIALSDAKGAAIYFDYVIATGSANPFVGPPDLSKTVEDDLQARVDILNLAPPGWSEVVTRDVMDRPLPPTGGDIQSVHVDDVVKIPKKAEDSAVVALAAERQIPITAVYGQGEDDSNRSDVTEPAVMLANLRLIETSKLTWEQVHELRKDEDSIAQLRHLLAFWSTDYSGKPKSQILNDLNVRVEKYERTAKSWGLQTDLTTASALLTGAFIKVISTAFIGTPMMPVGLLAATGLGALEIHIIRRKHQLAELQKQDPVQFLVEYSEKTND